ncbi:MAG TPA: TIGR02611 family protein [Mycobacterium sp.]
MTTEEQQEDRPDRKRRWARWRDALRHRPAADFTYRVVVAIVGLAVLGVGILAIPYPGPGWAIVFIGLAILATEFKWARLALKFTRERYDQVMAWFKRQGLWVQALGVALTAAAVLGTLWLLGALAWAAGLVGLEQSWLKSPIGLGS